MYNYTISFAHPDAGSRTDAVSNQFVAGCSARNEARCLEIGAVAFLL